MEKFEPVMLHVPISPYFDEFSDTVFIQVPASTDALMNTGPGILSDEACVRW